MSKFNSTAVDTTKTTNLAGGIAYNLSEKQKIVTLVLNSMLKDTYYQSSEDRIKEVENIVKDNPELHEFIAKAMVYTRNQGNLRSISHLLAVLLAENVKGSTYLRKALEKTIVRPDDMTEMFSLWSSRNKVMSNSLRRAMKTSLETKWDTYQLKKYEGKKKAIKLKDIVKLTRPNPKKLSAIKGTDENVFKQLIEDKLPKISTAQTINAAKEGYLQVLRDNKLGYMALLKNLVNILKDTDKETQNELVELVCKTLVNEKMITNSKVLPLRFIQALSALGELNIDNFKRQKIEDALEIAFSLSSKNLEFIEEGEKLALLLDESGSMDGNPFEIGKSLFASILGSSSINKSNSVGYLWATQARKVDISSPFNFLQKTRCNGGGTDVWAPISDLIKTNTFVDKIIIFTEIGRAHV